jgi:acyl-CoA thioester hydrolase
MPKNAEAPALEEATLDFRSELSWPGRFDIGTRVATIDGSSLTLEQGLLQDGACAATATTVIVHVSGTTGRSEALPESARQVLESLR